MVFRAESVIYLILTCIFDPTDRLPSQRGKQRAPFSSRRSIKGCQRTLLGIPSGRISALDLVCTKTCYISHCRPARIDMLNLVPVWTATRLTVTGAKGYD